MPQIRMEDHQPGLIHNGVHEHDQVMELNRSFWVFFTANLNVLTWVIGILVIALGMNFWSGLFVVLFGNAIGALCPAFLAVMGPKTRLTQMESSRASFGKRGTSIPAFLNWLCCIGWDVVTNVPSAVAFVEFFLLIGLHVPFWICLSILALVQTFIGFYGHHMVQWIQKSLGYALLAIFAAIGIIIAKNMGTLPTAEKPVTLQAIMLTFGIVMSNSIGYSSYASDYTRYLPKHTPAKSVFWQVFSGLFLSITLLEIFGLLTASAVSHPTAQALIEVITKNTGAFAPLALFIIAIACIPQNALNDNSGAYSLISSGVRIHRHVSAVLAATIAFVLALWGEGRFVNLFENFLLLILYWIFPWIGIVLMDWLLKRKSSVKFEKGWSIGATIWCIVTIFTITLFPATTLYTGPVAKMLGGIDIGFYVGFIAASLGYWYWIKRQLQ